jgi:hypothetical protein
MASCCREAHWYCTDLASIETPIRAEADKLRCRTWSHDEMAKRLHHIEMAEADRFLGEVMPVRRAG